MNDEQTVCSPLCHSTHTDAAIASTKSFGFDTNSQRLDPTLSHHLSNVITWPSVCSCLVCVCVCVCVCTQGLDPSLFNNLQNVDLCIRRVLIYPDEDIPYHMLIDTLDEVLCELGDVEAPGGCDTHTHTHTCTHRHPYA